MEVSNVVKKTSFESSSARQPSMSVRKGIGFDYDEPSEETSTLVLTAPSGKFVDIRFPLLQYGVPNTPVTKMSQFWAFSGVSHTTFYDSKDESNPGFAFTSHTVFKHDIDSKGPGIVDEGDDITLPNGDVMEVGIWPENGKLYKELWTQHEILPGRDRLHKTPVIVAETIGNGPGRGIMIRVGDFIQGVYEFNNDGDDHRDIAVARVVLLLNEDSIVGSEFDEATAATKETHLVGKRIWMQHKRNNVDHTGCLPWTNIGLGKQHLGMEFATASGKWAITEFVE